MQRRQLLQTASMGAALGALGLSGKAIGQSGPKVVVVGAAMAALQPPSMCGCGQTIKSM